jgi:hypothetical protein
MKEVITFKPAGLNLVESGNDAIVLMLLGKLLLLLQEGITRQENIHTL